MWVVSRALFAFALSSGVAAWSPPNTLRRPNSLRRAVGPLRAEADAQWGGEYANEAAFAAALVQEAVALCFEIQESMATARGDDSLGATVAIASGQNQGPFD